jgi:hypothetical protein
MVEDIEMQSGIPALGLQFVEGQLGEGKGYDDALDGGHADEGQALHGAERLDRYSDQIGRLVLALANAVPHSSERHSHRVSDKQEIHRGVLHGTRGGIPHGQPRAIDIKPADFEMQARLGRERQCQIRQRPLYRFRQQELLDSRARRAGNLLLYRTAGMEQEYGRRTKRDTKREKNDRLPVGDSL